MHPERKDRSVKSPISAILLLLAAALSPLLASDSDEFKIKRQEVFEFSQKPQVSRSGRGVKISFASKAYCDASVAIENARGQIVRHLVSGVLGAKAPEPFSKNSLKQEL